MASLVCIMVFGLSCSTAPESSQSIPEALAFDPGPAPIIDGELHIGIAMQNSSRTFFQGLELGANEAAGAAGVTLMVTDANDDPAVQLADVEALIDAGVHGIVLSPVDSETATEIAAIANEAGVPLVAVANQIGTVENYGPQFVYPGTVALVTNDDVAMGRKAATLAAKIVGDGLARIGIVEGKAGTANAVMRKEGFTDELDALGIRYQVVGAAPGDWTGEGGKAACEGFVPLEVDLVFSMSDAMTEGCVESTLISESPTIPIISIGGNKAGLALLQSGTIAGTVCQKPATMGALAVETMIDALLTGAVSQGLRFYETPIVTPDDQSVCIPQW